MRRGQVFYDRATGARLEVGATGEETGGAWASMERRIPPHGCRNPRHRHLDFAQTFTVRSGRCRVHLEGRDHVLRAGQSLDVPVGAVHHDPWNDFDEACVVENRVEPHLAFHDAYGATLGTLHVQSRLNRHADFPALALLAVIRATGAQSYMPGVPIALQRALMAAVAPLARLRGYRVVRDVA